MKIVSATRTGPGGRSTSRYLWLTIPSIAAVVAVNAAGIWGIAVARRGVIEESEKVFRLEISARARALESLLSSTRADLAFLAGSPAFFRLEEGLASNDPREARWRRLGAEGAILLFLRGHAEISHLRVISTREISLVEAGRRGGVPVLWMAARDAPVSSRESSGPQERPRISGRFTFTSGPPPERESVKLEAELDASILVGRGRSPEGTASDCSLLDGGGVTLAAESAKQGAAFATESAIDTEGWSAPAPWRLHCARTREPCGVGDRAIDHDPVAFLHGCSPPCPPWPSPRPARVGENEGRTPPGGASGPEALEPALPKSYHTRHCCALTIAEPGLHSNAFWNSGMFDTTPLTR